jgi:hypothetical protein
MANSGSIIAGLRTLSPFRQAALTPGVAPFASLVARDDMMRTYDCQWCHSHSGQGLFFPSRGRLDLCLVWGSWFESPRRFASSSNEIPIDAPWEYWPTTHEEPTNVYRYKPSRSRSIRSNRRHIGLRGGIFLPIGITVSGGLDRLRNPGAISANDRKSGVSSRPAKEKGVMATVYATERQHYPHVAGHERLVRGQDRFRPPSRRQSAAYRGGGGGSHRTMGGRQSNR